MKKKLTCIIMKIKWLPYLRINTCLYRDIVNVFSSEGKYFESTEGLSGICFNSYLWMIFFYPTLYQIGHIVNIGYFIYVNKIFFHKL